MTAQENSGRPFLRSNRPPGPQASSPGSQAPPPGRHRRDHGRHATGWSARHRSAWSAPLLLLLTAALAWAVSSTASGAPRSVVASIFIEANPGTLPAGTGVGLRGSCNDNLVPATATSGAFGS